MAQNLIKIGDHVAFSPSGKLSISTVSGMLPGDTRTTLKYTHNCKKYHMVFGGYWREQAIDGETGLPITFYHFSDLIETVLDGIPCDSL